MRLKKFEEFNENNVVIKNVKDLDNHLSSKVYVNKEMGKYPYVMKDGKWNKVGGAPMPSQNEIYMAPEQAEKLNNLYSEYKEKEKEYEEYKNLLLKMN